MKTRDCSDVERNLWRYVDRELPATELAAVSSHLVRCARCKSLYLERAREGSVYRRTFLTSPFGEKFVQGLMRRLHEEGHLDGKLNAGQLPGKFGSRRGVFGSRRGVFGSRRGVFGSRRGRWRRIGAVAAMLVCVPVLIVTAYYYSSAKLGVFVADGASVTLLRGGRDARPSMDGDLYAGDRFDVPEGAQLKLVLTSPAGRESRLELVGPAQFHVDGASVTNDFRARLESGTLRAKVARDDRRKGFMVSRGQAVARVVGTSFALEALPDRATRLTVYEGTVEFYSLLASLQREKVKVTKGAWVMEEGAVEPVPEPETDTDSESETGAGGDLAETAPPAGPSLQSGAAPPAGNERVDAAPTGPAGATAGPSPPPSTPPPGPRPDDGFRSGLDQPDSGDGN